MGAATTFALVAGSVTPFSVKYDVTCAIGGAAGNLDASGAVTPDLLTDTTSATTPANGNTPLHNLVATAVTNQAAARVLAFDREMEISLLPMTGALCDWFIDANTAGATTQLRLTVTAANPGTCKLVIRFVKDYSR